MVSVSKLLVTLSPVAFCAMFQVNPFCKLRFKVGVLVASRICPSAVLIPPLVTKPVMLPASVAAKVTDEPEKADCPMISAPAASYVLE